MNRRKVILAQQTTLTIYVLVKDDTGALAFSILVATKLFTFCYYIGHWALMTKAELSLLVIDLKAAMDFTTKVFAIVFNSLAYGVGVRV